MSKIVTYNLREKQPIKLENNQAVPYLDIKYFKSKEWHNGQPNTTQVNDSFENFMNRFVSVQVADKGNRGSYILGTSDGGKTKKDIKMRSGVCLDIDNTVIKDEYDFVIEKIDVLGKVKQNSDFTFLMHSTHSHTEEEPRYRLIIPFREALEMNDTDFALLAKKVADRLVIDYDPSSNKITQVMHYPTCSSGYEDQYELYYRDSYFLDAKQLLNEITPEERQMAASKGTKKHGQPYFTVNGQADKQTDVFLNDNRLNPMYLDGWEGAFCQVYNVPETFETFLKDKYECVDGRYRPIGSDSVAGIEVFENGAFCKSYHTNDVLRDKNMNAYQVLRFALFYQEEGKEVSQYTFNDKTAHKNSYQAINAFLMSDKKVVSAFKRSIPQSSRSLKQLLKFKASEKLEQIQTEFRSKYGENKANEPKMLNPLDVALLLMNNVSFCKFEKTENARLAMYLVDDGIYTTNPDAIRKVISWVAPSYNLNRANDVMYHLSNRVWIKPLTKEAHLKPVGNGVYNTKTKQLEPFTPEYIFTTKVVTKYIENAPKPVINGWDIDSFLLELACGNKEVVDLFYQVFNEALSPNTTRKKGFWLFGEGNSGKGTFQQLLINLVGFENTGILKIIDFDKRFSLGSIVGKALVVGDDVPQNAYVEDTSNMFSVLTGDPVTIEVKNKQGYPAILTPCVVQSSNGLPTINNKSEGTYRRFVFVPFNANFNKGNENPSIKNDFIGRPEVLEYILFKAINMEFEMYTIPKVCEDIMAEYRVMNDHVLEFVMDVMADQVVNVPSRIPKPLMYDIYTNWCKKNGVKGEYKSNKFNSEFKRHCLKENLFEITEVRQMLSDALIKSLKPFMGSDHSHHNLEVRKTYRFYEFTRIGELKNESEKQKQTSFKLIK